MAMTATMAMAALAIGGCGEEKRGPPGDLDVASCAGAWQVLLSPTEQEFSFEPRARIVRGHEGRAYVALAGPADVGIYLVDPSQGDPLQIHDGSVSDFWLEGDRLLYLNSFAGELYAMPATGGTPELVFTSQILNVPRSSLTWASDRKAMYWAWQEFLPGQPPTSRWVVWREPRDGEAATQLLTLSPEGQFAGLVTRMVPNDDRLLVAYEFDGDPKVLSVALDGSGAGERSRLPGAILGVSPDGSALWWRDSGHFTGEAGSDTYQVGRWRAGGDAAELFWTSKPANAYPLEAWPTSDGGWYIAGWEWATDGSIHSTVWFVGTDGKGTRVACDPEARALWMASDATSDRLYGITEYGGLYWNLVAIARP